ncbi:hypothetical protein HDV03_000477 [Kappamyces sp. JEL0829]|nr:hypothetical protein HDV03_000477 [Kappamyces sp. JEL0829]
MTDTADQEKPAVKDVNPAHTEGTIFVVESDPVPAPPKPSALAAFLSSRLFLNIVKANIGFIASLVFLFLPQFRDLFKTSSLGLYLYSSLIAIAGHAGQTVGRMVDGLVLLCVAIVLGGGMGALVSVVGAPSLVGMALLCFLFFFFFLFYRTMGPRMLGFSIFGCLLVAFGILGSVNGGRLGDPLWMPQPILYYSIVSFCIGIVITMVVSFLLFPTLAHTEIRDFLAAWIRELNELIRLTIAIYTHSENEGDVEATKKLREGLRTRLAAIDMLLNDVASEASYSVLAFPKIAIITAQVRRLTDLVMFMNRAAKRYRTWYDDECLLPQHQGRLQELGQECSQTCSRIMQRIASQLENPELIGSAPLQHYHELIEKVVRFEKQLRYELDHHYKAASSQEAQENETWSARAESMLSIYNFSLALENCVKSVLSITELLLIAKPIGYFPFTKWLPIRMAKNVIHFFHRSNYLRDGKFSLGVMTSFWTNWLAKNMWTLKSAAAMTIFLILFLDKGSRNFFNQYGLAGGLITLIIVLTPTMGGSYMAMIFQLLGSVSGQTLGMASFYAFGPNPYVLWVPALVIGFPSYFILIKYPQFTSIGLLMLIGFTSTTISCWNQQYVPALGVVQAEYWFIWAKGVAALCIGLGFGTAFNLFVFPKFARHQLGHDLAQALMLLESIHMETFNVPSSFVSKEPASALAETKFEIDAIQPKIDALQAHLFRMRIAVILAKVEPDTNIAFDSVKYTKILNRLQTVLDALRGAQMALAVPWYSDKIIIKLWTTLAERREVLVQTIQVLFRLYESSILLKRNLPNPRPSAVAVRKELSYQVLSVHLSASMTGNPSVQNAIQIEEDSDPELKWQQARQRLADHEQSDRYFGVGTQTDIYYYSYISWMRVASEGVDALGDLINDLY